MLSGILRYEAANKAGKKKKLRKKLKQIFTQTWHEELKNVYTDMN
jgi:hypothetical protein